MNEPTITDWIGAVSSAIGAIGIIVGFFFAKGQLTAWRQEAKTRRRSEVAEELIAAAHNVSDALKAIRSPFDWVPIELTKEKNYSYNRRYERLANSDEVFKHLRQMQIRAGAVLGIALVDASVNELFSIRNKVSAAIDVLSDMGGERETNAETLDLKVRLRREMSGVYDGNDEVGKVQISALEAIERELRPIARLEAG